MNFRIKEDRSLCKSSETSIGQYSDEAAENENRNKFFKAPVQCLDWEPVRRTPSVHLCASVTTSAEIRCKLAPSEVPFWHHYRSLAAYTAAWVKDIPRQQLLLGRQWICILYATSQMTSSLTWERIAIPELQQPSWIISWYTDQHRGTRRPSFC